MAERAIPNLSTDAALSADCRLLVPMRVQALSVDDPGSIEWADLTPQYDLLRATPPATLGRSLRPNLFGAAPEPPGAGIHLHWTLPAAFTRIDHEPGKRAVFRSVPNRWLVVRLWGKTKFELEHRAWVIESDYLAADGTNPWLTVSGPPPRFDGGKLAGPPRRFDAGKRLGRAFDLKEKKRGDPSPLTAVAPGNVAFSSFYPSCRDVFGFHDKDDDLQPGSIYCYIVAGWFADPAADPLHDCKDKGLWLARMGRLEWSVPDGTKALPTRILCHATIFGVKWPPPPSERVLAFPQFETAIGSSALDAIAAFVDQKTASEVAKRDRLLGQLQFAVLQDQPPTAQELYSDLFPDRARLTGLRARLHERMFTALPGGTRWEIDRPAGDAEQAARRNYAAVLELPKDLAPLLQKINGDQREYDHQQRELAGLQRELYSQWYRRRLLGLYPELPKSYEGELDWRIARLTPLIEPLWQAIAGLQAGIGGTAGALRDAFARTSEEALRGHVLIDRPMPRYWRANDPVLLMAGVAIPAIQDGASPLSCRVTGQTIAGLGVDNLPNYGAAYVGTDDLKKPEYAVKPVQELSPRTTPVIPADFPDLLCEALLLDPERAALLARIAYRKQRNVIPTEAQTTPVADALRDAQRRRAGDNFYVGTERARSGAALAAFRSVLSATVTAPSPWVPAFMAWDACYRPPLDVPSQDVLKAWRFDADAVDYARREPAGRTGEVIYQGYAPLSDTVGRGLARGKEALPWKAQYPEDGFVFDVLAGKSLVVQSLGGLVEAMIQQDAALQLPPLEANSAVIDEKMARLIDGQYAVAPLPDVLDGANFFPFRGGDLDIRRLWLVDTFGRSRRVIEKIDDPDPDAPPPRVYISRNLAVAESGDAIRIRLSPRLAQPSRLLFRWLSADNDAQEFLGDRATQPVCGWILPNRLDRSLLICDATGKVLGAVQSVIRRGGWDDRGIRWSKLPPAALDPNLSGEALPQMPRPGAEDIPNRHLSAFVNGLLDLADDRGRSRSTAFENLLGLIAEIAESAPPAPEQRDLAVLIGRPLALARASLRLELLGPPAADQSWSQLTAPGPAGFTDVAFGARLGDRRIGPDGLIGCFKSDDYRALLLSQEIERGARTDLYFQHGAPVTLTCDPGKPATLLTLLLDPRSGVHISSGILPTKRIDLPPELVSTALAKLEVPFLVAPVLGERREDGLPNIPLPANMPGEWRWTWRPAAGAKAESVPIKSETAPARSLFATMALYEGWLALRQQGRDRQ
ncbi:MAG: hypothetical protein ACREFP_22565 [Acetobacteraceae bacterium]